MEQYVEQGSTRRASRENGIRQVLYHPARPTRDGRTVLTLSPLEFLAAFSHLGLPTTPPPLSPARGAPQHDLGFDADPGFD